MSATTLTATTPVIARIPGFESPPDVISHEQTSMPRWGSGDWGARVLPAEASLVAVAFGDDAASRWRDLLHVDDGTRVARVAELPAAWSPEVDAAVAEIIESATAGSRIAFVGAETAILPAIAVAKRVGLNDEEFTAAAIGTVADGVPDEGFSSVTCLRPIFCSRCHETYVAHLAIGDAFDCPVCRTPLAVYYHYSPLKGAYLARPTGEEPSA